MEKAKKALVKLKENLGRLPILAIPKVGEPLVIYLFASREAISVILVTERYKEQTCLLCNVGSTRSRDILFYYREAHVVIVVYNE